MLQNRVVAIIVVLAMAVLVLCLCLALILGAVVLVGNRPGAELSEESDQIERTIPVTALPSLIMEDAVGSVFITAGDSGQIRVVATRRARAADGRTARAAMEATRVEIDQEDEQIRIWVVAPGEIKGKRPMGTPQVSVDFDLVIPRQSDVSIRLGAGDISLRGLQGSLGVSTRSGDISIEDQQVAGGLAVRSMAGNIAFSGHLADGAAHVMMTGVGDIQVMLSPGSAFQLDAHAGAGQILSDFPLPDGSPGSSVKAAVGENPTSQLQLTTQAGNIHIQRGTP